MEFWGNVWLANMLKYGKNKRIEQKKGLEVFIGLV